LRPLEQGEKKLKLLRHGHGVERVAHRFRRRPLTPTSTLTGHASTCRQALNLLRNRR
jgi:hypothetical protein